VLFGVLAISTASCKSSHDAAQVQPGAPAGKVVEVAGTVTVHHGEAAAPLAAGASVAADDVIETGGDGHVAIELAHNLARWELGPNKRERVADSLAWNLPRADHPAKPVEHDTMAAGRPAERSAAGTTATAPAPSIQSNERAERAKQEGATAVPPATPPSIQPSAAPPGSPPESTSHHRRKTEVSRQRPATIEAGNAPANAGGEVTGAIVDRDKNAGAPPPPAGIGGGVAKSNDPNAALADFLTSHHRAFEVCLVGKSRLLSITLQVTARGAVTTTVEGNAAAKACIARVVKKLKLPAGPAHAKIVVAK
jgi:hypothetical protein